MSRLIPLTKGQFAIVDDADFERLSQWKWHAQTNSHGGFYANRHDQDGRLVAMHRVVNGTPAGFNTDHRDGNGLNNRRGNLRTATQLQNMMNRKGKKRGTSKYKGVWADPNPRNRKLWRSAIRLNGRLKYLGRFENEHDAGAAYAAAAIEHFGEFANATQGATP